MEEKYQTEMIWIPWDIIINETKNRNNGLIKITNSLLELFCLKYKNSVITKTSFEFCKKGSTIPIGVVCFLLHRYQSNH